MAKIDYEKLACDVLGLKHPSDLKQGEIYHNIGSFQIGASEDAIRQITDKRRNACLDIIEKEESDLRAKLGEDCPTDFTYDQWQTVGFLSLSQYRDCVRHIRSLRKEWDEQPRLVQDFIDAYDPDKHTDDIDGYKNYLSSHAKRTRELLDTEVPALIPEHTRKMHSYVIGRNGYGKSTLLKTIIHSYVQQDQCGIVILDPHGDLAYEIARWKEFSGNDKLVLIDPSLSPGKTPCLNPVQLPEGGEADQFAQELTLIFEDMLTGATQPFSPNMKTVLQNTLRVLMEKRGVNLFDLYEFLTDGTDHEWVSRGTRNKRKSVRHFFDRQYKEPQFASSRNAVATKIAAILSQDSAEDMFLGQSTFDLEKLLNQRKVVVFNLAKGLIGEAASEALGRFILGRMYGIALRRQREERADRTPVHVFVDECHNFVGERVSGILAEARKYGIHLTLSNQFRTQIKRLSVREEMVKNTNVKLVGFSSEDSYLAKEMGQPASLFQSLEIGEFVYKAGNSQAVKIRVRSDLADNSNDMDGRAWSNTIEQQLERYYVPIQEDAAISDEFPEHGEIV